MYGHIWIYIQAPQGGFTARPFFVQFFSPPHIGAQMGSQKMAKRETKWSPKTQTASGAVLGCKKAPKREPKWTPRAHKGSRYGSKGCQDEAQGRPNLRHELLQSKTCIRDSSGTRFMSPKGSPNGPKMESKNAYIFKPFRASIWDPFWHLLGTPNGPNSRHNNKAKTKVRTTSGNAKMMEKRWKTTYLSKSAILEVAENWLQENKNTGPKTGWKLYTFWMHFGTLWGPFWVPKTGPKRRQKRRRNWSAKKEAQRVQKEGAVGCGQTPLCIAYCYGMAIGTIGRNIK